MKVNLTDGILTIALFALWTTVSGNDVERAKRIVYGSEIRKDVNFDSRGYYVVLTFAMDQRTQCFEHYINSDKPCNEDDHVVQYQSARCGGAVFAERVVLTACTCVADFWLNHGDQHVAFATPKLSWETVFAVTPGENLPSNDITDSCSDTTIWSTHLTSHPNCAQINELYVTYNYGLIFTNGILQGISPPLTAIENENLWKHVTSKEITCLFIGNGPTAFSETTFYNVTRTMNYAWRMTTSAAWCINTLDEITEGDFPAYPETSYTTSCSVPTGKYPSLPMPQDAGYPVSCDGQFFSVQGMSIPPSALNYSYLALSAPKFGLLHSQQDESVIRKKLMDLVVQARSCQDRLFYSFKNLIFIVFSSILFFYHR